MKNYTIAEEYVLPSMGKVYNPPVDPNVKIRSMTTEEEMRRLAPSDKAYKVLCDIIDDCLVEGPNISSYDMCLADYQFLLHRLRVVTYGPKYPLVSTCPYCRSEAEHVSNISELEVVKYDPEMFDKYTEVTLPKTGKVVRIKLQTPRMIDTVSEQNKELMRKSKNKAPDASFLYTVRDLIDTVDGEKLDIVQREEFVRNLPMMDTNYIVKYGQKLSESFGVQTNFDVVCPICGLDYTTHFRFTKEFFGPSIDE